MNIIKEIKQDEGLRLRPYCDACGKTYPKHKKNCKGGKLTIGYGHNLESTPITQKTATLMLKQRVQKCIDEIAKRLPCWGKLNANRRAVLIGMRYNLGLGGFMSFKRMIRALMMGDYREAASQIRDSKSWRDDGLHARYERYAQTMEEG